MNSAYASHLLQFNNIYKKEVKIPNKLSPKNALKKKRELNQAYQKKNVITPDAYNDKTFLRKVT